MITSFSPKANQIYFRREWKAHVVRRVLLMLGFNCGAVSPDRGYGATVALNKVKA